MPTVDGKHYPYTEAGIKAAKKARRNQRVPAAKPPRAPNLKGDMMGKGYNFTKNIGGEDLPDIGY